MRKLCLDLCKDRAKIARMHMLIKMDAIVVMVHLDVRDAILGHVLGIE
jgi:hypothetical protein